MPALKPQSLWPCPGHGRPHLKKAPGLVRAGRKQMGGGLHPGSLGRARTPPSPLTVASQKVPLGTTARAPRPCRSPSGGQIALVTEVYLSPERRPSSPSLACPPRSPAAASRGISPCPIQSGSQRMVSQLEETFQQMSGTLPIS